MTSSTSAPALAFNEEQRLLRDTAREFLTRNAPVQALRALRDGRDPLGYSQDLWQQMAQLGWAGITLPERHGGLDFGFLGLGAVLEETGRTLTASPLLATTIGANAVLLGGSAGQQDAILPAVARGELTLALALEEGNHHDPTGVTLSATAADGGYLLNGRKRFVADGHSADRLVVVARSAGAPGSSDGLSLFVVAGDAPGVTRQRLWLADGRNAANVTFDNVAVSADDLVGGAGAGWAVLEPTLDLARAALAAEMLGGACEAFERTVAYLKQREQFGVKIGSFQGLQHRAALLYSELEMARSTVMAALSAVDSAVDGAVDGEVDGAVDGTVDDKPQQLPLLASLAKATLNETAKRVTNEAVQMHGGIGVTDELDIGLFLKRARVTMQLFGDTGYHRDRYGTLCGF